MSATFLLGHLGIGLGLAWLLSWRSPTRIDYRLVLFGALLPDLIDKPLGYVLGLQTRLWAHTFLFLAAILAASFIPQWRGLRLVGFGVATHLLLDEIWDLPSVFWYPAYGWTFPAVPFSADVWFEALRGRLVRGPAPRPIRPVWRDRGGGPARRIRLDPRDPLVGCIPRVPAPRDPPAAPLRRTAVGAEHSHPAPARFQWNRHSCPAGAVASLHNP